MPTRLPPRDAARRVRGDVGRSDDSPPSEDREDLGPPVDVVAHRDAVDAGGDSCGRSPGDARAAGDASRWTTTVDAFAIAARHARITIMSGPTVSPMRRIARERLLAGAARDSV